LKNLLVSSLVRRHNELKESNSKQIHNFTTVKLAWLAVVRRKRRTIISVVLLSLVIGSSITICSTIGEFPAWISALSASSPNILLTYEKNSQLVGLVPVNSTIPSSDLTAINQIGGIVDVTPLIVKYLPTSLSSNPSIIVGLDLNFWQLGLGLDSGHWPQPGSSEAVVTVGSSLEHVPANVSVAGHVFQVVGVAISANLVLIHSIIIGYTMAQETFALGSNSSIFIAQTSSSSDASAIINQISEIDPNLATFDLSTSSQVQNTVAKATGTISAAIILVDALFAFAILVALTLSGISSRRWEYGLISTYGSRTSALRIVLVENWIVFALSILPALILGIGILGFFTYYFNSLFGAAISPVDALLASGGIISNMITALNYLAAFIAATLGAILSGRIILKRTPSELLSESHG
jgi:hypothetical protein